MDYKEFDLDHFVDQIEGSEEIHLGDQPDVTVCWYRLEDRTPMYNKPILFVTKDKQPRFGCYTLEKDLDGTIYSDHPWREYSNPSEETITLYRKDLVDYWMPFPKLPEDKSNG